MTSTNTTGKPATAGFGTNVVDSNRFYSMLLDARTATVTESMHDVAENLLKGEKDNAKLALDQLWALKKTLSDAGADDTLELLITYYQEKINALRQKEETIKKVSKDTRNLIEEKRKKDEELTLVKSHITTCTRDLKDLNERLGSLKKQEEELTFVERHLKAEISKNETQIVNGLYEIILRQPELEEHKGARTEALELELMKQAAEEEARRNAAAANIAARIEATKAAAMKAATARPAAKPEPARPEPVNFDPIKFEAVKLDAARADTMAFDASDFTGTLDKADFDDPFLNVPDTPDSDATKAEKKEDVLDAITPDTTVRAEKKEAPAAVGIDILNKDNTLPPPQNDPFIRKDDMPVHEPVVYPKSVVRMGGKIIGEYYHDGNVVTKDERHYIYNSRFMAERLTAGLRNIKARFSQETHAELIKVTEDAASRVRENIRFHFEVSTNEILNDKNLKMLSSDLRHRAWDDADVFANRLNAKIDALGHNYEAMLQEQMERCTERD
ncbi:MAG: hypothetical protein FWC23_09850 [Chitinispirillia bacterium]|nr:hypothetical protein [Chitinispirillia bacterium]MCL2269472.1 hypothetical protein [Chitinispirillia bacterium]